MPGRGGPIPTGGCQFWAVAADSQRRLPIPGDGKPIPGGEVGSRRRGPAVGPGAEIWDAGTEAAERRRPNGGGGDEADGRG
jgi:hypothetical protein